MSAAKLTDAEVLALLNLINAEIHVNGNDPKWERIKRVIMEQNL